MNQAIRKIKATSCLHEVEHCATGAFNDDPLDYEASIKSLITHFAAFSPQARKAEARGRNNNKIRNEI